MCYFITYNINHNNYKIKRSYNEFDLFSRDIHLKYPYDELP